MWEIHLKEVIDSWNVFAIRCSSMEEALERALDFAQRFPEVSVVEGSKVIQRYVSGRLQK